jgi:hypothetical protein
MHAIQLGITDSTIRFRAKAAAVVEEALGVDKEVASATSTPGRRSGAVPAVERQTVGAEHLSLRGGHIVWPDLRCDGRDGDRLALA